MIASVQNKALFSLLIFAALVIVLFDFPKDIYNLHFPAFVFLAIVASWVDYNRGYLDGKAYYTEPNPALALKEHAEWDHKDSLKSLVQNHPFCLMELEHAPCVEHDYPLPSGTVHLLQNTKQYTTLTLTSDGWVYAADTTIGRDVLKSGKYQPMLTHDAMRISQDKDWENYL